MHESGSVMAETYFVSLINTQSGHHITTVSINNQHLCTCRQADPDTPAARITYSHANAEAIPVQDGSQDMVASSFMVHEMPAAATKAFLADAHRALRPGGVIALVDGDPW